jgi:two-component system cell cycle response regulator DivK
VTDQTNHHALIVDDDANNLEVLASLLAAQDISHTAIQDPINVSAALEDLPRIDIVFCDLEMPKMDGYQLLSLLRQRLGNSAPIIACTVHLSEINATRELGFDGFLGKPLDPERFPKLIQRILRGQPVWELP